MTTPNRPSVLVFAGLDPSGGAGIQADIEAINAQGAHALPVVTVLTVQDNDRVSAIYPVDSAIIVQQARALIRKIDIAAVKIGIVGNHANALAIAQLVRELLLQQPHLPVVLDTVLASGNGDALSREDSVLALQPLLAIATVVTPNLPEVQRLFPLFISAHEQARQLLQGRCTDVFLKGGHGTEAWVSNLWFTSHGQREWKWPRLEGQFHGSGCTVAAAIAGQLAQGHEMASSLQRAQEYTQATLRSAYSIAEGQLIPARSISKSY